jgi:predicted ribosome quality control (RQC) complex YloA/Tae2 family protein
VTEVPDPHGERLIDLNLRKKDLTESLALSVEFFNPGNLLVVRGGRLVVVARPRRWAHRVVRVGEEYVRPPTRIDPWTASVAEFEAALAGSRTDRVSTLAVRLALGGSLAEEVLARTSITGSAPAHEDVPSVASRTHAAVRGLLEEVGQTPRGYVLTEGDSPVDLEPFRAARWEQRTETKVVELGTFSEAAERYFGARIAREAAKVERPSPTQELERQRQRQAEAIERMSLEATRLVAEADRIFAHYAEVESSLAGATEASRETSEPMVLDLGGEPTRVWPDRGPRESAQAIYEEAKRVQQKLAGAKVALEATDRQIREVEATVPAVGPAVAKGQALRERSAPLWFERFRWFISSENAVVVGGRDAASNDLVVRRYLKSDDVYVHADLHGAPSVVIKRPDPGQGEVGAATLREAGQFGVAFSKAWRAGLAVNDAFWVTADQVSKSAGSGEFVARGAWVIHGTKNFLKDLPLELALGEIEVQGRRRWSVGPPDALRRRGTARFLLVPGEERDREKVERELSTELGLSRSLLQSLLPAGGLSVRRA